MSDAAKAYPLTWPYGFDRTRSPGKSQFKATLPQALKNVQSSLGLFAKDSGKTVSGLIISSNVTLGAERPNDPGVAVWFTWDGLSVCIPVDRYATVAENLQAIHHVLEARRTELRHGTLALVRATFQGFRALPPPSHFKPWREVFDWPDGLEVETRKIEVVFRALARERHPDQHGGSNERMSELNTAKEQALKEANGG